MEEMIMYLTDEQIMLLEQLTYLTDDVADAAGVLLGPYDSVENLLQQFDDDALQRLEDPGNPDSTKDYTGGKKWAAIIRQIKSDPDLYSLDIVNKDDSVPAICFNDPDDLVEYLLSDPDMLAKVLAYFIKYVETYNLSEDEIRSLAELLIIKRIIAVMKRSS